MAEVQQFTDEEVKNLLKDINVDNKIKQKYSKLFELEKNIREILNKKKMSKRSFDIILDVLCGFRILIVIHTNEKHKKIGDFKSNTDFNYHRWVDKIEEISEPSVKREVLEISKNLRKALNEVSSESEFKKIETQRYGCKLFCPYCENEYIKETYVEDEFIERCPNCSKEYKVLAGKVTLWKSRGTGVVSYGSPEYTVRIKNNNDEMVMIFNSNYNLLHIKTGDGVYFTFKKKFLGSQFSDKPFAILNATSNTYSLI